MADVVRGMSFSHNAEIFTNHRYPGVRQPGNYEIDVSCELWFDESLFFHIIIECKNWERPVDRPQIQKLIQTRDAISAHKAAFASPVGYTREAVEVAKANGVALWVLAEGIFGCAAGGGQAALSICFRISNDLLSFVYEAIKYSGGYLSNLVGETRQPNLVPFGWLDPEATRDMTSASRPRYHATTPFSTSKDPVLAEVIRYILERSDGGPVAQSIRSRIGQMRQLLVRAGLPSSKATEFLEDFALPMMTEGIDVPRLFDRLNTFDESVLHDSASLEAPLPWIEENGRRYFIYTTDPGDDSFLGLKNNIVWANAAWLIDAKSNAS